MNGIRNNKKEPRLYDQTNQHTEYLFYIITWVCESNVQFNSENLPIVYDNN